MRASGRARRGEAVWACETLLLQWLGGWSSTCPPGRGVGVAPPRSVSRSARNVACASLDESMFFREKR